MGAARNTTLFGAGAITSALAASICCFGPLLLAFLGLGGGALLLRFETYRPYSLAMATLFLGAAFYSAYRPRSEEECAADVACTRPSSRKGMRIALWIVAGIVALAAAFPYFSRWLF